MPGSTARPNRQAHATGTHSQIWPYSRVQVGHLKTVVILAGGFLIFNEAMPPKKLAGVALSLTGIIWCAACEDAVAARPACALDYYSASVRSIAHALDASECCARYSYLKMNAKAQTEKAAGAAAAVDK